MTSHREKLISGVGGGLAILVIFWLTAWLEAHWRAHPLLIASMGATAVLLFAAPHAPFSQPWNVIGGHVVSALCGVCVAFLVGDPVIGGALAAGLAIAAMHYLRCLHPPGGASAIIPVLGGAAAPAYGFGYAFFPVGLGAALLVLLAIVWNYPFPWRRYPEALARSARGETPCPYPDISHADFVAALSQIDTFVDISEQDLLRIYEIACGNKRREEDKARRRARRS